MILDYRRLKQLHPFETPRPVSHRELDEVLIPDVRAAETPADMVERKLLHLLKGSHARLTTLRPGLQERLGISAG